MSTCLWGDKELTLFLQKHLRFKQEKSEWSHVVADEDYNDERGLVEEHYEVSLMSCNGSLWKFVVRTVW